MDFNNIPKEYKIAAVVFGALAFTYAALSITRQIRLLKRISVKYNDIKILAVKKDEIAINVGLAITNTSNLTIKANKIAVDILINKKPVTKIAQKIEQALLPKKTTIVRFNVFFNPQESFTKLNLDAIVNMIDYKNLQLDISGKISGSVDGITFSNIKFGISDKIGNLMKKEE